MVRRFVVEKPLLELGLTLGEGCVWDTRCQKLFFVDIDQNRVYTYDPENGSVGYESFEKKITAIALTEAGTGLVGTSEDEFVFIPFKALPFPPTSKRQQYIKLQTNEVLSLSPEEKRFNDGAVDPSGRFLAGTMGRQHDQRVGRLYSIDGKGCSTLLLEGVTCSNGIGFSRDAKKMYYTDSWVKEIVQFDYDAVNGGCTNRQIFSMLQDEAYGEPDGLCMDSEDGVWSARWQAGKVIRLSPQGTIDVEIDFPTAWHITCIVFGGKNLDQLYVTTAKTEYNGEHIPDRHQGGHMFVVEGLGYTGVERHRYKGDTP